MSSSSAEDAVRGPRRAWLRGMTFQLTAYFTGSTFILLALASGFLYWGLQRSVLQDNVDLLSHKIQVLSVILQKAPLDLAGLEQEAHDEAEVSTRSQAPFLLRVLDEHGRVVAETPQMSELLPPAVFPAALARGERARAWHSPSGADFLLAADEVAVPPANLHWQLQAALNATVGNGLLARYRRDIAVVLGVGLLVAAAIGAWIARRGLRPIEAITQAAERIGVQQLRERIQPGRWPAELTALAAAFDRMLDRLQEAFERLSRFSADLAHELRTPINNLVGEAQVALSRPRAPPEYTRVLQSALEEHARLSSMIDSMLFLAQADQSKLISTVQRLDGRAQLQAVAEFYQPLAEEQGVSLGCEGEGEILADPLLLRRAISNLLSNALKYTPRGGRVTLRLSAMAAAHALRVGHSVAVIDSGAGIPSAHLPRLGERFYRVDASRSLPGAGLGLAIVKSIMALHGGSVRIDSTEGQGTTVQLDFPPAPAATVPA